MDGLGGGAVATGPLEEVVVAGGEEEGPAVEGLAVDGDEVVVTRFVDKIGVEVVEVEVEDFNVDADVGAEDVEDDVNVVMNLVGSFEPQLTPRHACWTAALLAF